MFEFLTLLDEFAVCLARLLDLFMALHFWLLETFGGPFCNLHLQDKFERSLLGGQP